MECGLSNYDMTYSTGIQEQEVKPDGDVIYLPVSNETDRYWGTSYDHHKVYLTTANIYKESDTMYLYTDQLIWNVTAGQTEDTAAIYRSGSTRGLDLEIRDDADARAYVDSINSVDPGDNGDAPLCLIRNTDNVIAVRAVLSNGRQSEIKYYTIHPSWLDVSGTLSTQKDADKLVTIFDDNTLVFTPDEGQSMEGVRIFTSDGTNKLELLPQADGTYRCDAAPGHHWYYFYAVNTYGSIYYFEDPLDVYRDEDAPVITSQGSTESDGTYQIKLRITDLSLTTYLMDGTIDLKLIFDEAYSQRLGVEQPDVSGDAEGRQATFELAIDEFDDYWGEITPEDDMEFLWEAENVSSTGIYRVEAVMPKVTSDGYLDVTIYGAAK